jgi:dTDP-4-dehydro-6-deoxy-alpha-D-glucopyranose 2,3-dehydratase
VGILMDIYSKIIDSWTKGTNGIHSLDEILSWIKEKNKNTVVSIGKIDLDRSKDWFLDEKLGDIRNKNGSFFRITGIQKKIDKQIISEQPIIIQDEIGYLGIITKEINGVLHFLMQAKIEPGNINKIQISPTIQATKSNFTQQHGGQKPNYLDFFINAKKHTIITDQIQSEQSSRFYKKRNRNIIILVESDVEVLPSHKWMTLGQIKKLMKINNLVNMDTRTVLSCIPFFKADNVDCNLFSDKQLFQSIFNSNLDGLPEIYHYLNNIKMFDQTRIELVPLTSLRTWTFSNNEFCCETQSDFKVIFCEIEIEGREVRRWSQPLLEAIGMAIFGLLSCNDNGIKKFLVRATPEMGCFDKLELGPTVHLEPTGLGKKHDEIVDLFIKKFNSNSGIKNNVILSEEGGRFYHEQNKNVIIEINEGELPKLPEGYFWVDYRTLNQLTQINNCLNIQLRNLLSLLEV